MDRKIFTEKVLNLKGFDGKMFWQYMGVETDWCAQFVTYCMKGIAKISNFPKSSSCTYIKNSYSNRVNHEFSSAEVGDLILFELYDPKDGPDHIGIVIGNDKITKTITTIEGNTGSTDFRKSSVGVFTYSYDSDCFDCIVDMSSDFEDSTEETIDELANLRLKLLKIKAIIEE